MVELSPELILELDTASRAVAQLAGAGEWLPNPHLLITPFLTREAVLSSRIEDTQASVSEVFAFEAGGQDNNDAREVSNYIRALERGRELLPTLPISTRMIRELHSILMTDVRGDDKRPGELRDRQVHIGPRRSAIADARFVPPPQNMLVDLLSDWERFVHADLPMPPLIRCALMHYQFETIHPFNDGNGRIGRLLIPLFLIEQGVLPTPLLYLSAYFESDREAYYDQLLAVSHTGEWGAWLTYFLKGFVEIARDAVERIRTLHRIQADYRDRLRGASGNALTVADGLLEWPVVTAPLIAQQCGITQPGARGVIERLIDAGILTPMAAGRPQLYAAYEVINAIED